MNEAMARFTEPFVYRLRIRNLTSRNFVLEEKELRRGRWYRDGLDNKNPVGVEAGGEVEAFGIWAPPGSKTGYECRVVWRDSEDAEKKTGSVAVTVSVPFLPGKNRAGIDVSGPYRVEGWTGVPRLGREFGQTVTLREIVG